MPFPSSSAAFDPSNGILYVSSLYEDKVYEYNSSTLQLQSAISTNGMIGYQFSSGELYDPSNGLLYVAGLGVNISGIDKEHREHTERLLQKENQNTEAYRESSVLLLSGGRSVWRPACPPGNR